MFPAVYFSLLCSVLALNDFSNGTLHQSKRPAGALSQSESPHFKENIVILSLVIRLASPSGTPLLCHSALQSL